MWHIPPRSPSVKGPLKTYNHTRGFYAENVDEFWIYDQTFHLYDYVGVAEKDKVWRNPENDNTSWKALSDLDTLRIHQAHRLGIDALLSKEAK